MRNRAAAMAATATLLSLCVLAPAGAAGAEPQVWDGRMEITAVDPACAAGGVNMDIADYGALYRPKLQAGDPNSALVFFAPNGLNVNLMATDPATQMSGSNIAYSAIVQGSDGIIHPPWNGTVTFTVSPAPVTPADADVKITGEVDNFANITGCSLTIAGAFLSRQ